ncbi:MAG: transposase [Myxococcota bacterium]|jgi:hypothetical protein|nr:transposase [Myxococcota bacterium]
MGWADEEFAGIDLGDKRRDNRAVLLLEPLGGAAHGEYPRGLQRVGRDAGGVSLSDERGV